MISERYFWCFPPSVYAQNIWKYHSFFKNSTKVWLNLVWLIRLYVDPCVLFAASLQSSMVSKWIPFLDREEHRTLMKALPGKWTFILDIQNLNLKLFFIFKIFNLRNYICCYNIVWVIIPMSFIRCIYVSITWMLAIKFSVQFSSGCLGRIQLLLVVFSLFLRISHY